MKRKYQEGEVIRLQWEGRADALFVRGHMDVYTAQMLLSDHYDGLYRWRSPVQAFGRWSVEPGPDGCSQAFRDYDEPGRGRFPVMRAEVTHTAVDPYSWRERRERKDATICDCTDYRFERCACDETCCCHWHPYGGAWFFIHKEVQQ